MHAITQLATILACSVTVLGQKCYFPNGKEVGSDTACNPNALVSACCYDNQACLSNGLCVSDPHDPVKARLHRGTCTDAKWKSGNCPRHCLDIDNNGVPVYSCNSTSIDSYCCYDGCSCQASSGSEIFTFAQSPADVYTVTIIGESYTQTHTSTASSTSPPIVSSSSVLASTSTTNTISSVDSSVSISGASATSSLSLTADLSSTSITTPAFEPAKKPNTTALGVGLGVGIPIAALIGVGIFFLLRRRRNRANGTLHEMAADEYALDPHLPSMKYAQMAGVEVQPEREVSLAAHELSGERDRRLAELSASAPSTAGGSQVVELESPLQPSQETANRAR